MGDITQTTNDKIHYLMSSQISASQQASKNFHERPFSHSTWSSIKCHKRESQCSSCNLLANITCLQQIFLTEKETNEKNERMYKNTKQKNYEHTQWPSQV